ncbi:uncharacterized protein V1518DRAFT_406775 [Limtongia smithiae]|uniref:uncharacterized protein n=1 Tax=Limtongia smithiae TaxID=1125753 RepID=UPI0034CD71A1
MPANTLGPLMSISIFLAATFLLNSSAAACLMAILLIDQLRVRIQASRAARFGFTMTAAIDVPAYTGEPYILGMSMEIIDEICEELPAVDLFQFGMTRKCIRDAIDSMNVWKTRIRIEFGEEGLYYADALVTTKGYPYSAIYAAISLPRKSYCADRFWGVLWLNERYWSIESSAYSNFERVLRLNNVWWLHAYRILHVPPGSYKLTWALSISNAIQLDNLDFIASLYERVDGIHERTVLSSRKLPSNTLSRLRGLGWFELHITDFTVPCKKFGSEWQNILVEVKDTGQTSKHGLNLDYIKLTRIDESSVVQEPDPNPTSYPQKYDEVALLTAPPSGYNSKGPTYFKNVILNLKDVLISAAPEQQINIYN